MNMKKVSKRALALLLSLIMVLGMLPVGAMAATAVSSTAATKITSGTKYVIGDGSGNYLAWDGSKISVTDLANATAWTGGGSSTLMYGDSEYFYINNSSFHVDADSNFPWSISDNSTNPTLYCQSTDTLYYLTINSDSCSIKSTKSLETLSGNAKLYELTVTLDNPAHMTNKPSGGITSSLGEPFDEKLGTYDDIYDYYNYSTKSAGSSISHTWTERNHTLTGYRIPGLVTMNDGSVVASADIRYNWEFDGGGIDIVISTNDAPTNANSDWTWSVANYLGDNGNIWDKDQYSSTLMDPVIATDGETLYMMADLYLAGYSINSSSTPCTFGSAGTHTGFGTSGKSLGKLLLRDCSGTALSEYTYSESDFTYYLDGDTIYDSTGTAQSTYYVDSWFNIYNASTGDYLSNLFFADNSYFQVMPVSFIYLTTSSNGGDTWSAPQILNLSMEGSSWHVVGPGRGVVGEVGNNKGTIFFTAYNGSKVYLLYSQNGGRTWEYTTSSSANNESSIIELNDGTIRMFYKHGGTTVNYIDFTYSNGGYVQSGTGSTSAAYTGDVMISSLHYSKLIDGQEAILVCCPTSSYRTNGKIHLFLLDEENNMTLKNSYDVVPNYSNEFFAYSCMTELSDGSIGLLYEDDCENFAKYDYVTMANANASIVYENVAIADIVNDADAVIGEPPITLEDTKNGTGVTVTADGLDGYTLTVEKRSETKAGEGTEPCVTYSIVITDANGNVNPCEDGATVKIPYDTDLFAGCIGYYGKVGGNIFDVTRSGDNLICDVPHFSDIEVYGVMPTADNVTSSVNVEIEVGKTVTYTDKTGNYENSYSSPSSSIADMTVTGKNGNTTVSYNKATSITSGKQYLIAINGNNVLTNTFSSSGRQDYKWWTSASGLYIEGVDAIADGYGLEQYLWTIKATGNGYTIQDVDGNYLAIDEANNRITLSDTLSTVTITNNSGIFDFSNENYYMNNFGNNNLFASSWQNGASGWTLYEYTAASNASSTITFEGVAPGTTTAIVGTTQYNITVYEMVDITVKYVDENGNEVTTSTITVKSNADSTTLPSYVTDGNGNYYTVEDTILDLTSGTSPYSVTVTKTDAVVDPTLVDGVVGTTVYEDAQGEVDMTAKVIKALTITAGSQFPLTVNAPTGSTVTWSIDDTSVATVSDSGVVTAVSVDTATVTVTVTNGAMVDTETVKITVIPAMVSGNETVATDTCFVYIADVINVYPYASIHNTDGYAQDMIPLEEGQVIFFERPVNVAYGILTTSTPYDGYALTYMAATGTQDQYYALHSGDYVLSTQDNYYVGSAPYYNLYTYYGYGNQAAVDTLLNQALAEPYRCDGAMSMGRKYREDLSTTEDLVSSLSFCAQKLPEMKKEIVSVTRGKNAPADANGNSTYGKTVAYYDGIAVYIEDTINYAVTVYVPVANSTYGDITYSAITLKDETLNETWISYGNDFAGSVSNSTVSSFKYTNSAKEEVTYTGSATAYVYETDLTLTTSNFTTYVKGGKITNAASLAYTYQSQYSSGSLATSSSAVAEVSVEPAFVVDFGLPIDLNLSDMVKSYGEIESIVRKDSNAELYGSFSWNADDNILTYTPTTVMLSTVDLLVTLADGKGQYYIAIHPASNVLYEETFMNVYGYSDYTDWTLSSKETEPYSTITVKDADNNDFSIYIDQGGDGEQTASNEAPYGYDVEYTGSTGVSGRSYYANLTSPGEMTDDLIVDFYGDCFDLIGTCGPKTGYVYLALVAQEAGGSNKTVVIDTSNSDGTFYQVPLAHVDLTEGKYRAYVYGGYRQVDKNGVSFFGGTVGANDDLFAMFDRAYEMGLECDDVEFVYFDESSALASYANSVMMYAETGTSANTNAAQATAKEEGGIIEIDGFRVYGPSDNGAFAVGEYDVQYVNVLEQANGGFMGYIEGGSGNYGNSSYEAAGGPQNEIYLPAGESVVFNVNTSITYAQISARAVTGETSMQSGIDNTYTIKSNTEMYYDVELVSTTDNAGNVTGMTIVIKNTGDNLLALGNLKLTTENRVSGVSTSSLMLLSAPTEETYTVAFAMLRAYSGEETPVEPEVPTEPETPEQPETPSVPSTPVKPGVPSIIWPTYTPSQNNVFRPDVFEMDVESYTLLGKRFVSIIVDASTDVSKLTINGAPVWASNYLWVKSGRDDQYRFTMLLVLDAGEKANFQVVAYDKKGVASKIYTITD